MDICINLSDNALGAIALCMLVFIVAWVFVSVNQ